MLFAPPFRPDRSYHITHHVSSITHWSEMPLHFIRHLDQYEAGGAILFQGIAFDDITFNVFAGEKGLRRLAKKVVQITPNHLTEDELVAKFRKRLKPIASEATRIKVPQVGVFLLTTKAFCHLCLDIIRTPFGHRLHHDHYSKPSRCCLSPFARDARCARSMRTRATRQVVRNACARARRACRGRRAHASRATGA